MVSSIERCAQIAEGQECYADQDRALSANPAGQSADGDIADDGCHGGHHQAVCITAVFQAPYVSRVARECSGDCIIGNIPKSH